MIILGLINLFAFKNMVNCYKKNFALFFLTVIIALSLSSCKNIVKTVRTKSDINLAIAWTNTPHSVSYESTIIAAKETGANVILLDMVESYDLSYKDGSLTSGKDQRGMLTSEAAKLVKCNKALNSNVAEVMKDIDCVIFPGGWDISPTLYYDEEEWHGIESDGDYCAERDVSDYLLISYCLEKNIPIYCICRGMQMLAVVSGAKIVQDIEGYYEGKGLDYDNSHRDKNKKIFASHDVEVISKDSLLYKTTVRTLLEKCPSWHHQMVEDVSGTRLTVTAVAANSSLPAIEAIERKDQSFCLGVQYHPEIAVSKVKENAEDANLYMDADLAMTGFNALVENALENLAEKRNDQYVLSEYWTEGSEAAESLNDYILAVTDKKSPDFIPVESRIAVFDLDGTLMCETYPFCFEYMLFADYALNSGSDTITEEVRAVAQEIIDAAGGKKPDGMSTRQAAAGAIAYKGMTMDKLAEMVDRFKDSEAWGFSGMKRGQAFYKPMVELFEKLKQNDFTIYIVTATERNIVRAAIAGTLDIPASHVIGTEYGYTLTGQGDTPDTDYTFQSSDQVVFDGSYHGENAKTSKVDAIVREIGQQPVLAFGNSSGDLAMEIYTISGNRWKSAAYMVVADDEEREYGNASDAEKKKKTYSDLGIGIISMRSDFKTIYGDDVHKVISDK